MAALGIDLGCVFASNSADLDPTGIEVSGRTCLAQAIARRLLTPRGRLLDDPNYGFDVAGYMGDDLSTSDLAQIRAGIENECVKDERVEGATAELTLAANGTLLINVTLSDADGPFTLVLAVSAVSVSILSVGQ